MHSDSNSGCWTRAIEPRSVTTEEKQVIEWLLDNAATCDVAPYRVSPAKELWVVGGCSCGCASLDFRANASGQESMLTDAVAPYSDNKKAGLILWGRGWEITGLEIYALDPVADRFPKIQDLCRWEDLAS